MRQDRDIYLYVRIYMCTYLYIYTGKEASVVGRAGKKRSTGREGDRWKRIGRGGMKNGGGKKTENRNRTKQEGRRKKVLDR